MIPSEPDPATTELARQMISPAIECDLGDDGGPCEECVNQRAIATAYMSLLAERDRYTRTLEIVLRIAKNGPGEDTTPDQCLATIATFIEGRAALADPTPRPEHSGDANASEVEAGRNV